MLTILVRPVTPPTPLALSCGPARVWLSEVVAVWGTAGGGVRVVVLGDQQHERKAG